MTGEYSVMEMLAIVLEITERGREAFRKSKEKDAMLSLIDTFIVDAMDELQAVNSNLEGARLIVRLKQQLIEDLQNGKRKLQEENESLKLRLEHYEGRVDNAMKACIYCGHNRVTYYTNALGRSDYMCHTCNRVWDTSVEEAVALGRLDAAMHSDNHVVDAGNDTGNVPEAFMQIVLRQNGLAPDGTPLKDTPPHFDTDEDDVRIDSESLHE